MSFGAELKDFATSFGATYNVMADRRDKKWMRDRAAIEDPINNEYKKASTESMKLHNKWYDKIADISTRTGEKNLEWYDRSKQSAIDANDVSTFRALHPARTGAAGDVLEGDTPDGAPDASGSPVGDHYPGPTVDDSGSDTSPDTDTGTEDTGGDESVGDQSSLESTWLKYANAGATRNQPLDPKLKNALAFLPDMGVQAVVFSGGQDESGPHRTGSHRHDDGRAADMMFVKDGRQLDWANPDDQPIFQQIVEKAKARGVTGIGAGPGYMREGSMHMGFGTPAVWGAGGRSANAPGWLKNAYYSADAGYARGGVVRPFDQARGNHTGYVSDGGYSGHGRAVYAARGGAIPDINNPDDQQQPTGLIRMQLAENTQPQQALPVDAPIPQQRPVDQAAPAQADTSGGNPDVGYDPSVAGDPRVVGFTKAHEAVLDGIRYSLKQAGLAQGAAVTDPERAAKMADYLKGAGAAPMKIIDQAYQAVDPKHELPDSERTMAALGTVYDHYIKRGEPDKAKAAAASIVQYQRKLFQQYSSIAKAAIADGDIDAATKAAVKAYASVPDGQNMTVKKLEDGRYQIDVTDEATGKTISKPVLTPQEIGGWAMKVNPGSFDQFIMDAAGVRKQGGGAPSEDFQKLSAGIDEGKLPSNKDMAALPLGEQKELRLRVADYTKAQDAGGAKAPTYTESNKVRGDMATAYDNMASQTMPNSEEPVHQGMADLDPGAKSAIIKSASDIMGSPHNRSADYNVAEEDAISAAFVVSQGGDYKAIDKDNGKQVTLSDGTDVWMPIPRFKQLENIHKRDVAAVQKKAADDNAAKVDSAQKSRDRAARDKKNREEGPGLLGGPTQSPVTGGITPQSTLDDLQKLMNP